MSRTLRIIGIGPGDPRQITIEAIEAMAGVDAFVVLDKHARGKGATDDMLVGLRREICDRYIGAGKYRFVEVEDPPREANPDRYPDAVEQWHDARSVAIEQALVAEIPDGGVAAILVWGDPALYDSSIRIANAIVARRRIALTIEVIAGVTSASALTAAHQIVAHRIGESVLTTTGRRLPNTPAGVDANQIVMLDAGCTFLSTADPDDEIYWGAYVGTPAEILISGTVGDVGEQIRERRAQARAEHGWIMDIYLLRKPLQPLD